MPDIGPTNYSGGYSAILWDGCGFVVVARYACRSWRGNIMVRLGLLTISAAIVATAAFAQSPVERGSYLVNGVLTCGNCHTPKGPPQAIAGKDFSGGLSWDEPPFKVTAPNITPDKATGIGNYTDAQIKTMQSKGVKPNDIPVTIEKQYGF